MSKLFALIILLASACCAQAQKHAKLPPLSDWFLSTGDWDRDPQLYVREFGNGADTVIMLHGGWGGDHAGLLDAVAPLSRQFHFIFYDQRGSLRSPFPDASISYAAHIEDVERLRKELGLNKIKLAAHSMGGVLACAYATKYPDRIKSLILLAPADLKNPIPEDDRVLQQKQREQVQAFLERPEAGRELEKYGLTRPDTELSSIERTSKFRINFARRMLYDLSKWPLLTGGGALYKGNVFDLTAKTYPKEGWDFIASLQDQPFSVSIIMGDHDFIDFGNVLVTKWIKGKNKFTFTPVKNAGHLLWIDQPEAFAKELSAQLKKN